MEFLTHIICTRTKGGKKGSACALHYHTGGINWITSWIIPKWEKWGGNDQYIDIYLKKKKKSPLTSFLPQIVQNCRYFGFWWITLDSSICALLAVERPHQELSFHIIPPPKMSLLVLLVPTSQWANCLLGLWVVTISFHSCVFFK